MVNATDKQGRAQLHVVGSASMFVEESDGHDMTAAARRAAADSRARRMIQYLLGLGADRDQRTFEDRTPLGYLFSQSTWSRDSFVGRSAAMEHHVTDEDFFIHKFVIGSQQALVT